MINLSKILCPVDLSKGSLLALRFANAVAGRYRSSLTVIHVLDNPHADIPGAETGAFTFGEVIDLYKEDLFRLLCKSPVKPKDRGLNSTVRIKNTGR